MTDVVAGRFALCDPIARGGSGTVWRAYDRKQERFCAAKLLRKRDAGDLLRFVREQSVRLGHPNVLTPYSWAAEDAHVVIASELVDGGSLSTLLGDWGPLSPGTVAAALDQLLLALEQVHAAGLVHRDVKPANVLLHATGGGALHLRLGDFGIAIGDDDAHLTQVGTVVGTPAYLAPELLAGGVRPNVGHDLFAVGKVAAALAAGAEPPSQVAPADLSGWAPGPLRDLVADLGALDPGRRPHSARQARERLRAVALDRTPRTRDGAPIEVLHQLPALSEDAVREAGVPRTLRLDTRSSSVAADEPAATPARSRARRRPRRGVLLSAAGVAVVAAIGIPVGLALADDGTGGGTGPTSPSTKHGSTSRSSASTGSTGSSGDTGGAVRVGAACSFKEQNDTEPASGGGTAKCVLRSDGSYVWQAVS